VNSDTTIASRMTYARDFLSHAPANMEKCIFIDESGFNLHLHRNMARSKIGSRAKIILPTVRGRNVSLVAAMSIHGIIHTKVIDDGNCNGPKFCAFVRELVAILLQKENLIGSWLIMDNARIHKTEELRDITSNSPYQLKFLSPYSYMLNPIENVFSKIKASVRSLLRQRVSQQTLTSMIEEGVRTITQEDCTNYVMNVTRKLSVAASGQPMET